MEVFGDQWLHHRQKVLSNWQETLTEDDTMLLCGDTSWSMELEDAVRRDLGAWPPCPGKL